MPVGLEPRPEGRNGAAGVRFPLGCRTVGRIKQAAGPFRGWGKRDWEAEGSEDYPIPRTGSLLSDYPLSSRLPPGLWTMCPAPQGNGPYPSCILVSALSTTDQNSALLGCAGCQTAIIPGKKTFVIFRHFFGEIYFPKQHSNTSHEFHLFLSVRRGICSQNTLFAIFSFSSCSKYLCFSP